MPPSPSSRTRRALVLLGVGAAVLFVLFGLDRLDDVLHYPWANARSGRPVLVGTWVGRLATGSGRPYGVQLDLRLARDGNRSHCRRCNSLVGAARTCDAGGRELRYRVVGTPDDRRATTFRLGVMADPEPGPDGLELDEIRGRWDGADALALEGTFVWRRGASAVSSTDDPDTQWAPLPMTRAAEGDFAALCRRVASRAPGA